MPKPANVSSLAECHSGDRSQPGIGSNTDYSPYVYQSLRSVQAVASSIDAMSGSEPGAICLEAHSPLEDSLYQRSQLGLNHNSSRTTIQSKLVLSHSNPQTLKPEGQASDGGIYIDDRDSYCFQAAAEGYSEARGITAGGRSSHNNSHWPSWVRANDGTKTLATPGLLRCSSAVEDVAEHGYGTFSIDSGVHQITNNENWNGNDHKADPKTWAQPFECHYFDPSLQESFPPSSSQTSTPPESSIIPTCTTLRPFEPTGRVFPNTRSKEGLPSNSHHLLNSPEMTNLQVAETSNFNQAACTTLKEEPNITRGEKSIHAETGKHLNNASQSPTQSPRMTRSSVASRRAHATPKKIKVLSSQNLSSGTADPQADPPSDDAASILLSLSRNEPSKHGMALRRGRGGVSRSEQPLSATLSSEKPHLSPTTSNKRYRTRSQIHEENVVTSNSPEAPPMELNSLLEEPEIIGLPKARKAKANMQIVRGLGYGPPPSTCSNEGIVSVSGSNDTSSLSSASRSTTGDSILRTPAPETCKLYNLIGRAQVDQRNRSYPRISDCSKAPSTATTGTSSFTAAGSGPYPDDDARSSFSISTQATSLVFPTVCMNLRTFPAEVPIDSSFPRLYRTFFVSSAFGEPEPIKSLAEKHCVPILKAPTGSVYNPPAHGFLDLYTPRYVKGVGSEKVGLCCICSEPKERGGEDHELWLKMKVSSYSYHLSFFHGINNTDGLPFSPPSEIRLAKRGHVAANEKTELKEGLCHQCNRWIPMEGVKMQDVKVAELFWWKHAKSCHKSRIFGESNFHILDEVYDLVVRHQSNNLRQSGASSFPTSFCSTPYNYQHTGHDSPMSQSFYGGSYNAASPAPTCASSGSHPSTSRVHPSVAAQRASAGRVYKRKISNNSTNRQNRHTPDWKVNCSPLSIGVASTSSLPAKEARELLPQSPTPQDLSRCFSMPSRKTRRCNSLKLLD